MKLIYSVIALFLFSQFSFAQVNKHTLRIKTITECNCRGTADCICPVGTCSCANCSKSVASVGWITQPSTTATATATAPAAKTYCQIQGADGSMMLVECPNGNCPVQSPFTQYTQYSQSFPQMIQSCGPQGCSAPTTRGLFGRWR